jgi:uncharacterized protein YpmB
VFIIIIIIIIIVIVMAFLFFLFTEEKAQRQSSSASSAQVSTTGTESLFGTLDLQSMGDLKQAVSILVREAKQRGVNLPKVESEAT